MPRPLLWNLPLGGNTWSFLPFIIWVNFELLNRYPANVPEKELKKKLKELIWCSRLSSYKMECPEEGVKPCTIRLTHRAPKCGLELLHCNGSTSTYTATSRRLLPASIAERFLEIWITRKDEHKKTLARNNDTNGFKPVRNQSRAAGRSIAPTANYYSASDRTFWPIYGPGAGYLLTDPLLTRHVLSMQVMLLWCDLR